ncbi:hypothetical protein FOMPIDRAFT_58109 [Fomitopsis schrenkii]|uniref:DNA-directed DNA polymerase n=1 Tax=Fomitopsis schrenkii TaxID=2126942 RepID=S8FP08_FOMSC|nr:hypothetical protein FOMPIDRAFT_58109 [Fomitopsis schrenkii]
MQCTDSATGSPSLTAHDKARGTHIVDGSGQRCANASSSGHNVPARTPTSSTSVVSPQSGRRGETKESPKGAASAVNARASSHAVRPDVSLHSKVLKVSGRGEDPETAPSRSSVIRPALPAPSSSKAKTARGKRAAVPEAKSVPARKTGKQKRELLTPLEYAQRLHDKMADAAPTNKSRAKPYLRGMRILYYGGDRTYASEETTGHMDHIIKHGGVLVPVYDPAVVTHIVTTDRRTSPVLLCERLGLRSLKDIPDHIPTVKWSYINKLAGADSDKQIEGSDPSIPVDYEPMFHAAFTKRIDAGIPHFMTDARPKPQMATAVSTGGDYSRITPCDSNSKGDTSDISCRENLTLNGACREFTHDRIEPKESMICDFDDSIIADRLPGPSRIPLRPQAKAAVTVRSAADLGGRKSSRDDPLAPFYREARAEKAEEDLRADDSSDDEQREPDSSRKRGAGHEESKRRGFLCDSKPEEQSECANQDVIDKLNELKEVHKSKMGDEDKWRVYAYDKAIRALRSYPTRIRSLEEARAIKGIGDKTAQKIVEILKTGDLRRIAYEKTEDVTAISLFQGIYGVGRHTAFKWYNSGCRTLDDIFARKGGIKLSACQEIGLKHYADINSRMPRSEAGDVFSIIKPIALNIDPKLFIEIMGSYRRGKATCGDIDILITRPTSDGRTHQGVLRKLLAELRRRGVITEDLSLPDSFDDLELVYRGLCRKGPSSPRRRIDFLTVPYESRGAALLYYTFNRSLRLKANKMGYSLNQRGLYKGVIRNPSNRMEKLDDGILVASETEAEILQILGVPWQEPHERVRG